MAPTPLGYNAHRKHERHNGILVMPVCSAEGNAPPKLIRVHDPYETVDLNFEAAAVDSPPSVPSADSFPEYVCTGGVRCASVPNVANNEAKIFSIWGSYNFVMPTAEGLSSDLPTGRPTIANEPPDTNNIPGSTFRTDLMGHAPTNQFLIGFIPSGHQG